MGLALLFPGQGAQHPQMLPWLEAQPEARPVLEAMARHLGPDWRENLSEPAWMHANGVAQRLLTGISIAAWQVLAARLPPPAVVAGYSVGELAAFAAAGVFDATSALDLAAVRAQAMNDSVAGQHTGLLAVQGPSALRLAEASLAIAIRISAERVIVGGTAAQLDASAARWSAAGLRCTRLPIAIASHTPAMSAAAPAFARRLAGIDLHPPRAAVVCNFTGTASRSPAALASALVGQIANTVRWDDCMDSIAERGVRCVLEVGPGAALASMWRERHPDIPVRSIDEFQGPEGVLDWVQRQLG
ncbi:[acyl-carrier-protein] S-malonyltransferase [Pelomonas saccharophila]|uniref:[acyl-carrier-protein] S-malonyltransferase n=1 Tax=Roseateles saccharophilus TaxID=304 RepID=A0ABU1YGC1_ROSSA|nr:acyltransferase domain-containing protein [Roseateles saccharophilus]MDR7267793.1 [acyl-carrier-protein] S-malonyltransferase [Roseateles saccharophilus]